MALRRIAALAACLIAVSSCATSTRPPAPIAGGGDESAVAIGSDALVSVGQVGFENGGNIVATPTSAPLESDWPDGALVIGDGVDVELTGDAIGSFPVTLRLPDPPSEDAIPAVLHVADSGEVDVLQGYVGQDEQTITVQATAFSKLFPAWLNPVNWIAGIIDGVSDFVTGRTDPPHCNFDPPGWATVDASLGATHTCLQSNRAEDGTERVELLQKSNRRGFMAVTLPAGADYVWVEGQPDWVRPLLARATGNDPDTNILLPGGQQMSFGFRQPVVGQDVEIAVYSSPGTILLDGAFSLLGVAASDGPQVIVTTATMLTCFASFADFDPFAADFSVGLQTLSDLFSDIVDCALNAIAGLADDTSGAKALGVVTDLVDLGALKLPAEGSGAVVDEFVKGAKSLGSVAKRVARYLQVAGAGVDLFDKIYDNSVRDITTSMRLRGSRAANPQPGDYNVDLSDIAVGAGAAPMLVVLDTSGSMNDPAADGVKIETAKRALLNFLRTVEPDAPVGLWTYPTTGSAGCGSGQLRIPIQPRDPARMEAVIRELTADGDTPTAEALLAAVQQYEAAGYDRGTVLLISDGESTCDDPCEIAASVIQSGFELEVIGVGFQGDAATAAEIECLANATNGAAINVTDADGLADAVESTSRPTLDVAVDYLERVVADVGAGQGTVKITATITNTSRTDARNVIARLRFTENSPGVAGAVRALGNLAPEASTSVTWSFGAGLILAGKTVTFDVVTVADNLIEPDIQSGAVEIVDASQRSDVGTILDVDDLVIMGDSYSSGEGADGYIAGTDVDSNPCHRSLHTYLAETFELTAAQVMACSGALIPDLDRAQPGRTVPSQLDQLRTYSERPEGPPDAVVMTIGGNDAGFKMLALDCILSLSPCNETINDESRADFFANRFATGQPASETALAGRLVEVYRKINGILNSSEAITERGSVAPILVPAYPLPVPTVDRACLGLIQVTQAELSAITQFAADLNGLVEAATVAARTKGVPVWFVPTTEDAFQPNHTVCDREPWARGTDSFNGAGLDASTAAPVALADLRAAIAVMGFEATRRGINELLHPNGLGYDAMTRAIIRWSQTDDAAAAAEALSAMKPADAEIVTTWSESDVNLGQIAPGSIATVQAGTIYPLQGSGFAPGTPVEIRVESSPQVLAVATADGDGNINTTVAVPHELPVGEHTLFISGYASDFEPATTSHRVRVSEAGPPILGFVIPGFAAMLWLGAGVSRLRYRRKQRSRA